MRKLIFLVLTLALTFGVYSFKDHAASVANAAQEQVRLATTKKDAIAKPPSTTAAAPVVATPAPAQAETTAPAPTVAATPAPAVQVRTSCPDYRGLVAQYDWNVDIAMAIMKAESSCNPNAISPLNYDGLSDYGLFQIHGEYILDPAANVARAYGKYQSQGWRAWSTYTSGAYYKYL